MYFRCCFSQPGRCFGKKPRCSFCLLSGAYFHGLVLFIMESVKAKWKKLLSCRGCLGCYPNRDLIIGTDEALKHLKNQGQSGKNLSVSEDFWSTSTCEMENSAALSQRSMSSTGTSFQVLDPQGCPVGSSRPSEFINYDFSIFAPIIRGPWGTMEVQLPSSLLVWNQTRQQWIGNKRSQSHKHVRGPRRSWNGTYESLLATNRPFPQPIPLSEMVDFLVDVWEQEGLYD